MGVFFRFLVSCIAGEYLVERTAQWLDNPVESPLEDAVSRHKLDGSDTSAEEVKKRRKKGTS